MKKTLLSVLAGILLGFIGARYLFVGSWLILIPWAIAGLLVGFTGTRNESLINGAAYGFILSLCFLAAGYAGQPSLISRIPFFLVLSSFGAICGVVLGAVGYNVKLKVRLRRPKKASP